MDAAARPALRLDGPRSRPSSLALGALLAAAVFAGRGRGSTRSRRSALAALLAAAAALAAARSGMLPLRAARRTGRSPSSSARRRSPPGRASRSPGRSPATARGSGSARGLVYLAFLALGLARGGALAGARRLAALLAVVVAAALGWALLGVAIPSLFEDGDRIARLREPRGLLERARAPRGRRRSRSASGWRATRRLGLRVAGASSCTAAALALLLTQSRAGLAGAVAVLVLWLVLRPTAPRRRPRAASSPCPRRRRRGLGVHAPRARRGRGAARRPRRGRADLRACWPSPAASSSRSPPGGCRSHGSSSSASGLVRGVLAVACAGLLVVGVGRGGGRGRQPVSWASSQVSGGECANDPGRLTDLCANNRLAWWEESLRDRRGQAARRARAPGRSRSPGSASASDATPGQRAAQRAAPAARRPRRRRARPRARS